MSADRIDLFTRDEVQRAKTILSSSMDTVQKNKRLRDEIITDEVMQRIDCETGQKNDRRYMAYRLEYVASA